MIVLIVLSLVINPHTTHADMNRGMQNYQAIMKGVKKIEDLSLEELREVTIIHKMMKGGVASGEGCDAAYSRCVNSCESESSYYDYDSGEYLSLSNTDYVSKCTDACSRGRNYCEDEEKDEMCYEFKRACRNDCPSSIYDYSSGDFKLLTDVESKCEEACEDGERACD